MKKKLIGQVKTQSGRLMIIDPVNVDNEWIKEGNIKGVVFWGRDHNKVAELLIQKGYKVQQKKDYAGFIKVSNEKDAMLLREKIAAIGESIGGKIVSSIETDSTLHDVNELTMYTEQAGALRFKEGIGDLAIAFNSGLGDGDYNVYATYKNIEGWGERITKVEIQLVDDEQ